ncbi:MAG: hypothetical protein CSA74_09430 [Rhodobacterales bacterium]|nr:MAG: hypothetical protein CSA74_09430 [Rhodobacterales bacterium]
MRGFRGFGLLLAALLGMGAMSTGARGQAVAPELQAASNFGQTWDAAVFEAARAAGITALRDELHWDFAERDGELVFDHEILTYPEKMAAAGMRLTLIALGEHPDHDGGATPYTPEAVAAFADFFAGVAARYPAVVAVEIGNEMNSESFTEGPAREAGINGRAGYYATILAATARAVRAARPDVRLIGGAAHSIPLAWFSALSAAGAATEMEAVAFHPYTTPPEQLRRQVALLREVPGFEALPLELTEIGTKEPGAAPALLAKSWCQAALAGATTLAWYPLSPRGDGYVPLLAEDGRLTDVGRSWQMLKQFEGLRVTDAAPDPFTYGCRFGDRALLLWGADRGVTVAEGLTVRDLAGRVVKAPRLSRDTPLLITSEGLPPRLGETVHLGAQQVVADSFDQFAYPGRSAGGFARFVRVSGEASGEIGGQEVPFILAPGQQEDGVPWTPYLTTARDGWLRMDAGFAQPSVWDGAPAEIVHAFTAPEAMAVSVEAEVAPGPESAAGVALTVRAGDRLLVETVVQGPGRLTLPPVMLAAGEVLEIVLGPGASGEGSAEGYRFTLRRAG